MIVVFAVGSAWTWRLIADCGRTLVYTAETWASDLDAFAAAKRYRAAFWEVAAGVDHRMGACL